MTKDNSSEITQERLKEVLDYNKETGVFTWIKKTSPRATSIKIGAIAGNLQPNGRWYIMLDGKTYLAHRLAWLYVYGYSPTGDKPFIDHINGKPADNRLINLRVCSHSENQRNTKKPKRNTSGFKGVSYHKVIGKFCAYIVNSSTGKTEYLGLYDTPEEASVVQIAKSIEYYGEFHPYKLL